MGPLEEQTAKTLREFGAPLCADCLAELTSARLRDVRDAMNGLALTNQFGYEQACGRCHATSGGIAVIVGFQT